MIIFAILIGGLMLASTTNIIDGTLGMIAAMALAVIFSIVCAISAYKSDVKLVVVLMAILMVVEVGVLSYNIVSYFVTDKNETFYLTVDQDNSTKTKLFSFEGKNYYTYKVKNIIVHSRGREYTLESAFNEGVVKLEDILSDSIPSANTSGYEVYYDGGIDSIKNDKFSIFVCHNTDYIFSSFDSYYTEKMCND